VSGWWCGEGARQRADSPDFGLPPVVERFAYPERFASKIENGSDRNAIIGNGLINAKRKSFGKRSMESIFNFMNPRKIS
jgi:hypothetical protein